ncbi:MAG: DUF2760 domain-containing protein [Desulfatibacillaceae bacterium]
MKSYVKRAFGWLLLWMILFSCAVFGAMYWKLYMAGGAAEAMPFSDFAVFAGIVLGAGAVLFTLLGWACLRASAKKHLSQPEPARGVTTAASQAGPSGQVVMTQREQALNDQRRTLHMLSILQREGRLLDFLSEDLEQYDDDQIGAAVRGIQESCKKVMEKHLSPEPVMSREEGDEVVVEPGFDPDSVKLVGNVSGQPPFKGVLRHRGWRAGKFDLPTFHTHGDPRIMAPAEVEVE